MMLNALSLIRYSSAIRANCLLSEPRCEAIPFYVQHNVNV